MTHIYRQPTHIMRLTAATILVIIIAYTPAASLDADEGVSMMKTYWVYRNSAESDHHISPWKMQWTEMDAGEPRGKYLWLNADWQAQPWAGVTFRRDRGEPLVLMGKWLKTGFFRFFITGGLDRYGSPNAELPFQLRLLAEGCDYQRLRSRFIDRGRGLDEDPETWQEVLVPLTYWTDLKPGAKVTGLSIQCVHQPLRSFGFDEVGLVLYDRIPEWLEALDNVDVAQPWVVWPTYDELPDILKADKHPPLARDGKFVWPNGRRTFLLNPYLREDPRLVYWGSQDRDNLPPNHDLYDPQVHGWIYDDIPTAESLCRLGFNSFSATMPSQPWWDAVGYDRRDNGHDAGRLSDYAGEVGLPFYVDLVCWPWTLGQPAARSAETDLPASAFTKGRHHWTPYRIIGSGRDAWLRMWRLYAERYRDAGVNTIAVELMNEPAYTDVSEDHRAEFIIWLKKQYADLADLNQTWGTEYQTWNEVIEFDSPDDLKRVPGLFFDYDAYLAERFTELIADGVETVSAILPSALVGIQTMGGYAISPREAVWKHLLVEHETVVLAPTGGGRWTPGSSASKPMTSVLESPMAAAPLENDLLLALAGEKMVFDNETYLRGQTAREVRNRLWDHVLSGLDGLSVFSWSKRGWAWRGTRAEVVTEADKYPYSVLIPLARRTDALRGIHDFAAEVQPLAHRILPKPWGPDPKIGLLYSWANTRRRVYEPELPDRTPAYYAALKYTHTNFRVIPSHNILEGDALSGLDVVIAGGIRHAEETLASALERFVRAGGVLIVGEELMALDLYGNLLDVDNICGVDVGDSVEGDREVVQLPEELAPAELSGDVYLVSSLHTLKPEPGTSVLIKDARDRPVVTKRSLGKGFVYVQGADLVGYPLAKLLWTILADASGAKIPSTWRLARIHDATTGQLAPNILLSRRSYDDYHVFLLMNRDGYDKTIRLRVDLPSGNWYVYDGLSGIKLDSSEGNKTWGSQQLADDGLELFISSGDPAVILIERAALGMRQDESQIYYNQYEVEEKGMSEQSIPKKRLNLKPILDISLDTELKQLRVRSVRPGKDEPTAILAIYSSERGVDPWSEAFFFPKDTLKMALFTDRGEMLWRRDLGPSVMPGAHFCPVSAFDLDGDGKDEIWFVNNIDLDHPLSLRGRRLERIDAATGKTTGQWYWPNLAGDTQSLSHTHRNFIFGGYVRGEPVLVTAQGTYGPMFLQGWRPDMTQRWDLRIAEDEPGARSSHGYTVIDLNDDGVDEVLWGERCIELDTGTELFCADRDVYHGHSDVVQPFQDPATDRWYIYTCREGDPKASPRVAVFDDKGQRVWGHVDKGHMDMGWVAKIGENGRPIAMAIRIGGKHFTPDGVVHDKPEQFTFDALTGEEYPLDFDTYGTIPADIDGDGYDELLRKGEILDRHGNVIGEIDGIIRGTWKYIDHPKLQILSYKSDGSVRVWIDE